MTTRVYDLEAVYDTEIAPLMSQIIDICKQHDLPMIASFAYAAQGDEDFDLCTTFVAGEESIRIPRKFEFMRYIALRGTERL